jgi:UDP-N-acetylglucosamine 2-epimerase (hydrolysing)
MKNKKILFLSGTRADFGKLKSLITISQKSKRFNVSIFVTGMHLQEKYGYTVNEIEKSGFKNIYKYENHTSETSMDLTLSKTIEGLSAYVKENKPNLIIVHGDRVEALAGAIVGSLNNILVGHVEGGEVSGTIDELIRHSVSKMSHIHFVSNQEAKNRLVQMGEVNSHIFEIGSPDIDIMFSPDLPSIEKAKKRYDIPFEKYALLMLHPVTTEKKLIKEQANCLIEAVLNDNHNYIVIYPNNDMGSSDIINAIKKLENNKRFRIFPSLRFEHFLTLLKNSKLIIGNSSAGVREAPYYEVPSIDLGNRQKNRARSKSIIHCTFDKVEIAKAIEKSQNLTRTTSPRDFGNGKSDQLFYEIINQNTFWKIPCQKQFKDQKLASL